MMTIKQFHDAALSHYSYAIISEGKMALVDPGRDPWPYYQYADEQKARIVAIFETHPHADFVSGHFQIHMETGAPIYVSKLVEANYPHKTFDDGQSFTMGKINFEAINTPGHSPDSICILATDADGQQVLFSGDTLFIGDVGRPDLRENSGDQSAARETLARKMYHTVNHAFNHLSPDVVIYPSHGAGSLCGKNLSTGSSSTLGEERKNNWAFQTLSEEEFVKELLKDQPFIPAYFKYNVELNKKGASNFEKSIADIPFKMAVDSLPAHYLVVDVRDQSVFKKHHLAESINIMARSDNDKFETWLGAIVKPHEKFYLVVGSAPERYNILKRLAKIGYENKVKAVVTLSDQSAMSSNQLDLDNFKQNPDQYTIIDIRNNHEVAKQQIFADAVAIPLHQLRDQRTAIPLDKPIVVHCAAGYRSAAGSSILENLPEKIEVYDLGEAIAQFK